MIAEVESLAESLVPGDADRLDDAIYVALDFSARARKVARLIVAIPAGDTAAANLRCAHELAGWP